MLICEQCGEVFEQAKVIVELHPYGNGVAEEEWYVCPRCEGSRITEAQLCNHCGEYFSELEDGLCEDCYEQD